MFAALCLVIDVCCSYILDCGLIVMFPCSIDSVLLFSILVVWILVYLLWISLLRGLRCCTFMLGWWLLFGLL